MDSTGKRNDISQKVTEREAAFVTYRLGKILFKKGDISKSDYYKEQTKRFISPEFVKPYT